jgi:outer membrane lipoprotein
MLMKGQVSRLSAAVARERLWRLFPFALFLLVISSCAYAISQEWREKTRPGLTFSTVFENPDAYIGSIVIWGGIIVDVYNRPGGTDITVLETPLSYWEKPEAAEYSRGRFIVKALIFMDPAIYRPGRRITVAGEVVGKETKALGGMKYTYPLLKAKEIHLWSKEAVYPYPPDYYYWRWYGSNWWPYDDYWD